MFRNIIFIALLILFQGCSGTMTSANEISLSGKWMIESIEGKPVIANSPAYMEFSEDNRISGNASCNRFFGNYTLTGSKMTIGEAGSTRMMCAGPFSEQENRFLSTLSRVDSIAMDNGYLSLKDAQDIEIIKASKSE
jgi:heat shock protein HslJ